MIQFGCCGIPVPLHRRSPNTQAHFYFIIETNSKIGTVYDLRIEQDSISLLLYQSDEEISVESRRSRALRPRACHSRDPQELGSRHHITYVAFLPQCAVSALVRGRVRENTSEHFKVLTRARLVSQVSICRLWSSETGATQLPPTPPPRPSRTCVLQRQRRRCRFGLGNRSSSTHLHSVSTTPIRYTVYVEISVVFETKVSLIIQRWFHMSIDSNSSYCRVVIQYITW